MTGEGRWGCKIPNLTGIARILRNNLTEAEKYLWYMLRSKNLKGLKFRRQQPIGKYIVDFVCFENKLIIEVDGGQHATDNLSDTIRDKWLGNHGFHVLRFWNNEILENRSAVLEKIRGFSKTPSPNPSHRGRGKTRVR